MLPVSITPVQMYCLVYQGSAFHTVIIHGTGIHPRTWYISSSPRGEMRAVSFQELVAESGPQSGTGHAIVHGDTRYTQVVYGIRRR